MTIDNVLEILEKHKLHIPSNVFYELKADIVNFEEPTTKDDVPENNVGNIELTTKNDLAVDCIVDVLGSYTDLDIPYKREIAENILIKLPSVTPQEPRWILVSERLPEEHICDDAYHEPSKSVLVQMKSGAIHTARYWSRYDERWLDLNYPTTDEVIAWMSLPQPYREVEDGNE